VVLLHGWGAPGDDLVPLAQALVRPGVRFFVPVAPLPEVGGGRAWWHLDPRGRPPHAWDDELDPRFQPNAEVVAARTAIQQLLRTVSDRHAPDLIALAGFSQGAMLSMDVALSGASVVQRVVAMSGVLLQDSLAALKAPRAAKPAFLLSHGRQDPVVPFQAAVHAKELLEKYGLPVSWHPFAGGHEIPEAVLAAVARFLFTAG
jgi:phospholipase/carboxylesterase